MRRSLAGLLLGLAAILASIAVSAFWLHHTAFSPEDSASKAHAVLGDTDITNEIARAIAEATTPLLNTDPTHPVTVLDVQHTVATSAATTPGAAILAGTVADAHARLIGDSDKPAEVTAAQMVPLLGNELAATAPTITLEVPKVTALSIVREVLTWMVPIAGAAAVLLILLGLAARPERAELLRSIGFLLLGIGLMLLIVGYIVPVLVLPLFSKDVWMGTIPRLARDAVPLLLLSMLVLVAAGVGCLAASGATRRRDRWSQPIRTRYHEQRRWS